MRQYETITLNKNVDARIGTFCIVCNEVVLLTQEEEFALRHGHRIHGKVCDKCKRAILHIRNQID